MRKGSIYACPFLKWLQFLCTHIVTYDYLYMYMHIKNYVHTVYMYVHMLCTYKPLGCTHVHIHDIITYVGNIYGDIERKLLCCYT